MTEQAAVWRAVIFFGVLAVLIIAERVWRRKTLTQSLRDRWVPNLGVFLTGTIVTRGLVVFSGLAASLYAARQGWGIFNILPVPEWVAIAVSLILLDMAVWFQHVLSHRWQWLWRLHRVHHSDMDIDVTTALRFHPVEIGLSLLYKSAIVIILGAPLMAVLLFDILLNGLAMFNHANLVLPQPLDRVLRKLIVTPDMHRVHHSVHEDETNSNYGFCLSLWDRIFGVYTPQPRDGHKDMVIGLSLFRDIKGLGFWGLLIQPRVKGSAEVDAPSVRE